MKTKLNLVIILVTAGVISGCGRNDQTPPPEQVTNREIKEQARDSANATKDAVIRTKDEFVASMDKKMAELDAKIDKLENKSANATGDAKVRADEALADLRTQRSAVHRQYDDLKAATGDAWDKTKDAFQSAWDGLVRTYDKAAAKLSSD